MPSQPTCRKQIQIGRIHVDNNSSYSYCQKVSPVSNIVFAILVLLVLSFFTVRYFLLRLKVCTFIFLFHFFYFSSMLWRSWSQVLKRIMCPFSDMYSDGRISTWEKTFIDICPPKTRFLQLFYLQPPQLSLLMSSRSWITWTIAEEQSSNWTLPLWTGKPWSSVGPKNCKKKKKRKSDV